MASSRRGSGLGNQVGLVRVKPISLILILVPLFANPSISRAAIPRIVAHLVPSLPSAPHCADAPRPPCNDQEENFNVTGSVGTHYHLYILAVDQPASYSASSPAGIAGAVFGIAYNDAPSAGVDVQSWTTCGDLAFGSDTPPWPASGSGMIVTWDRIANCQNSPAGGDLDGGVTAVLAVLDIDVYSSDFLSITRRESSPLKDFQISDCTGAAIALDYPAAAGKASFGTSGAYDPCRGNFDPFSDFASLSPSEREKIVVKLTPLDQSPKAVLFLGAQGVVDTTAFKSFRRLGFSYLSDTKNAVQPLRQFSLNGGSISSILDSVATLPEVTDGNVDANPRLSFGLFRRTDAGVMRGFEAMLNQDSGASLLSKIHGTAEDAGAGTVVDDLACVLGMTPETGPEDVTHLVRISTGAFHLDHIHGRFVATVRVVNLSGTPLPAPVSLILNEGPRVVLQHPSGYTCRLGTPGPTYFDLDVGETMDPGESAVLTLTVAQNDPPKLTLSPKVVSGPGAR
jgi:hypothetical protein